MNQFIYRIFDGIGAIFEAPFKYLPILFWLIFCSVGIALGIYLVFRGIWQGLLVAVFGASLIGLPWIRKTR